MGKEIIKSLAFYLLFLGVMWSVFLLSHQQKTHPLSQYDKSDELGYLPSGKVLKSLALTYDEIVADVLWIKTIAYIGKSDKKASQSSHLYQLLDTITTLDPFYVDPYESGGVLLSAEFKQIDKSFSILKKGMENVPKHHKRYWYLPFFTAFNYMYYKGDYQTAAKYLEVAASFPQSPSYLPLLVARLYANTDDPAVAIPFLQEMLQNASTPKMKEEIESRIKEILVKSHIKYLNMAMDQYKENAGHYPENLFQLVKKGLITEIPREPFGGKYFISAKDHSIQTTSDVDDMKLHIQPKTSQPFMLQMQNKK